MGAFPSAAAQLKLPEQPDLLGQVQKITALKSLLQGQQLQQQQIQAATLQNQAAQRKLQEGEVIRQAFVKNQGDIDKTIADASQNPVVSPETLQALQLHSIDLKTKRAAADEGALKLRATQVDNLRGLFQPIFDMPKDAPPEQIDAAYQQQRAQALKNPQAYGITDPSQIPAQFPGKQQGEALMASMVGESKQIADETARREIALKQAQTGEAAGKEEQARAEAELKRAEIAGGGTGAMADSKYRNILQKQNLGQPLSAEDKAWKTAYEKQKTLVPTANINLQAGLLNQSAKEMAAQYYQQTGALPAGMRSPAMSAGILNQAAGTPGGIPDIAGNKRTYATQTAEQKAFTSGPQGQQLTAINTAREHMKTFSKLADALDNSDVQALNKLGNAFGVQFGSDKATNLRIAAQAFGGEVGRAFDGAGVTAGEREKAESAYASYLSKGQFRGAIQTVDELLAGKQRSLKQSYEQGMKGQPNFGGNQGGGPPAGATHTAMGSDNKKHYTNAKGEDLGIVP